MCLGRGFRFKRFAVVSKRVHDEHKEVMHLCEASARDSNSNASGPNAVPLHTKGKRAMVLSHRSPERLSRNQRCAQACNLNISPTLSDKLPVHRAISKQLKVPENYTEAKHSAGLKDCGCFGGASFCFIVFFAFGFEVVSAIICPEMCSSVHVRDSGTYFSFVFVPVKPQSLHGLSTCAPGIR